MVKNLPANAGDRRDAGSIHVLGRSPGETHFNVTVWRIPMSRGAWWAAVHGVAKSWTRLSNFTNIRKEVRKERQGKREGGEEGQKEERMSKKKEKMVTLVKCNFMKN